MAKTLYKLLTDNKNNFAVKLDNDIIYQTNPSKFCFLEIAQKHIDTIDLEEPTDVTTFGDDWVALHAYPYPL